MTKVRAKTDESREYLFHEILSPFTGCEKVKWCEKSDAK